MFTRLTGAALRAVFVTLLIAMPSLILHQSTSHTVEAVVFVALLGGILVFAEYASHFPSLIQFRDAPPLNRMRFLSALFTVFFVSVLARHDLAPNSLTTIIHGVSYKLGTALDFAYSPVQLMMLMLPSTTPFETVIDIRNSAGLAYAISLLTVVLFGGAIRIYNWPVGQGAFNVWTNLPLFDPTTGGDVVQRLSRDARISLSAGLLLPFALPGCIKLAGHLFDLHLLTTPLTQTWLIAFWACASASITMRGLALLRVADLIAKQRKRVYDSSETLQTT
ncbi:hypothetical protein [Epibacterium ulvae]|uniref:Uncharacterized protein n=1 Tax=Epibacterium ulvae TaxID=1156985 RepID=A0A1G5R615_9RHOB|nr:hypothetical protein [Epibacterium ulvae]SCZ69308.1 hypothetical protein SAMN04488118_10921 [Epibacterium ulvae]